MCVESGHECLGVLNQKVFLFGGRGSTQKRGVASLSQYIRRGSASRGTASSVPSCCVDQQGKWPPSRLPGGPPAPAARPPSSGHRPGRPKNSGRRSNSCSSASGPGPTAKRGPRRRPRRRQSVSGVSTRAPGSLGAGPGAGCQRQCHALSVGVLRRLHLACFGERHCGRAHSWDPRFRSAPQPRPARPTEGPTLQGRGQGHLSLPF